ncbi:MAG TPA: TIGR04282 family arsenosugar biosynthesis glycosyltransferase [Thermodesulfobacteriota bacterium]|nr:TIGR04282 family arsenosugar biosynthesis glycosyltransferase [Thermodesulfobacteriota bacterium]
MSRPKLNHTLLIFVKYPEPGRVKTRLAEDLGHEKAAEIYASMAESVIHNLSESEEYKTIIFFDPPDRKREMENWLGKRYRLLAQEGNSLGERMANALEKTFSLGAEKAVIIGTDCLEITEEIISRAFQSLDEMDLVLGPAEDGGYYLLGMKESIPEIFDDITWSTSQVLGQTINKIKTMGLKFSLLKTLRDIDTISDFNNDLLSKFSKSKNS